MKLSLGICVGTGFWDTENHTSSTSIGIVKLLSDVGFPSRSVGKESACKAGEPGSITGLGSSLEKGMATPSSILAWRIPWTEEPGGLQSRGVQKESDETERLTDTNEA